MHPSWWPYDALPCALKNLGVLGRAAVLVCLWGLLASCGEAEPDAYSEVTGAPTPGADAGRADAGKADAGGADASGADAGERGADGAVDEADATEDLASCEGADEHLGVLDADGDPTIVSRTLSALEGEPISCVSDGDGRGEYVFAFEVDQTAILEMTMSAVATSSLSFALYEDGCTEEAQVYCSQRSPWRTMVEPNKTYFLKVQAAENTDGNTFNASFGFDEAVCTPGETTCADSSSNRCLQGTSVETYSCASGCSDEEFCAGDTCGAALTIEPVPGGAPVVIDGERWAYTHQWNAAELSDCEASETIETGQTTAMELFVQVPGLEAGQILEITRDDDSGSYVYFVLDDCDAGSCREAMFVDDAGDNRLEWEVPDDGDYVVVIEALSNTSRSFSFEAAVR